MHQTGRVLEKYRNYLFFLLLIIVYLVLDFQTILFLRPQGIHFIRQTDGLSFAAGYFKNGFHFFQPQVFNLQSEEGKAACEFPLLYYIAALLYQLFGEKEFVLRSITLIIASSGFFYLFRLLSVLLENLFYALAFTFLFISSTVLLYYTNNFLPDASALGFTLIGWYFFFSFFSRREKRKALVAGFIFFSLASLLKVTYFINPVAAMLAVVVLDISTGSGIRNSLRSNLMPMAVFGLSLITVVGWNIYVLYYNNLHHDNYFLIRSNPIWSLDRDQIAVVWDHISNYWYSKYYYQSTFHVFLLLVVAGVLFVRNSERKLLITSIILAMGSLAYFLLFFAQFRSHDYYFIALIPSIILLVINAFVALKNRFPLWVNHVVARILILGLCLLSLNYAREKMIQRYSVTDDFYDVIGPRLAGVRQYMDASGIAGDAKIVIITDQSPNGGLYFLNRPGWNIPDTTASGKSALKSYISRGAEYVVLTGADNNVFGYIGTKTGGFNGVQIYKISK